MRKIQSKNAIFNICILYLKSQKQHLFISRKIFICCNIKTTWVNLHLHTTKSPKNSKLSYFDILYCKLIHNYAALLICCLSRNNAISLLWLTWRPWKFSLSSRCIHASFSYDISSYAVVHTSPHNTGKRMASPLHMSFYALPISAYLRTSSHIQHIQISTYPEPDDTAYV